MITKKPAARGTATSVTFTVPADAAMSSVAIVGSFNDWNEVAHLMKLDKKRGVWTKAISLKPGRHTFRYLADNETWLDDDTPDETEGTPFGSRNGVVVL